MLINYKICGGCKIEKQFSDFNKCKRGRYGLHNHCRECQKITKRKYYELNREKEIGKSAIFSKSIKGRISTKERYEKNKDYILKRNRDRRKTDKCRKQAQEAWEKRAEINPNVRLANNARVRIRKALKGIDKSASTFALIGCTVGELKKHIESQFQQDMTWDNYGYYGWHIDHIKPCNSFNLKFIEHQKECFHYTNLRPLWRFDNQSKGDRILNSV